jgi:hypothetical protein
MPITNTIKNRILYGLAGQNSTFASSVYVGLSSTDPATKVTEPARFYSDDTPTGYNRVLVGIYNQSGTYKFGEVQDGAIKNDEFIYFPESNGSWGAQLTHFVLYSAETGGDLLAYGLLESGGSATPITVSEPRTVVMFRPDTLVISIADEA